MAVMIGATTMMMNTNLHPPLSRLVCDNQAKAFNRALHLHLHLC
jgi:hypothetical protein